MDAYLETIAKDPSSTSNEQLKRIMSLFHALWKQGWQSLVKDLVKKETFWSSLCSPLFANPIVGYQFSQLFNILGIEIFKIREEKDFDENLKKVIVKFLEKENLSRWLEVVFNLPTVDPDDSSVNLEETPEWLSRLQSFKDFLVLLLRKKSFISIKSDSNKLLLEKSLDALVKSSNNLEIGVDTRPFIVLSEIYLILLNDQKVRFTKTSEEDKKLLRNIESLLRVIASCYDDIHSRAKDSILAIAVKSLELESDEIKKYEDITSNLVLCDVEMLCYEFFKIENSKETKEKKFSLVLVISLLKKMLLLNENEEISSNWTSIFTQHKVFNRLIHVISLICQDFERKSTTAELLDLLVIFAKGNHSKELIFCDMSEYLWLKMLPPKELVEIQMDIADVSYINSQHHKLYSYIYSFFFRKQNQKSSWTQQDWWIIYSKGVQLVKILLEKHQYFFIKDALFFVGIHEEYLTDCLMLVKTCLEPNAVKLIKITLELISEVVAYENCWRTDYSQSIMNLMV
jgi:nuclear pore complex protein Nup188